MSLFDWIIQIFRGVRVSARGGSYRIRNVAEFSFSNDQAEQPRSRQNNKTVYDFVSLNVDT